MDFMSHPLDGCDQRDDAPSVFAKQPLSPERADRGAMSSAVAGPVRGCHHYLGIWGAWEDPVAEATPRVWKGLRAIRESAARQCTEM